MSRVIARHYASSHQILLRVRQVIEIRHAIENLANGSFGLAIGAVLEVHIGNLDPTTDKNVRPTAYI